MFNCIPKLGRKRKRTQKVVLIVGLFDVTSQMKRCRERKHALTMMMSSEIYPIVDHFEPHDFKIPHKENN